jgi:ribosomal protein S1
VRLKENSVDNTQTNPTDPAQAANEPATDQSRRTRQPSMAQIMESDEFSAYLSGAENLTRNALLKGIVAHVDENTGVLLVDVGAKSEGIVAKNEVGDEAVKTGDEIEVVVLQSENEDGHPVLSKRRADFERLWRSIVEARDSKVHLEATVTREVKGGLIVDLGVSAFIPASHVSSRSRANLGHLVGKTIPVQVIEVDRKKDKVIASHRLAADAERQEREEEAWGSLEKDTTVEGIVRRITDFGAFVDIGGVDGLLHVREMAWNRVEHPSHVVKKGQKLQVLVLDIDRENKKIALGLKQLQSDPWKKAAAAYKTGQNVTGKVTHIAPSCAFVELEEGIEAIIPISEMSEERIKTPEEVLTVGQEVEARVKQVQPGQRKITLSLRAAVRDKERRETRDAIREVNQRATGGSGDGGGALKLGDIFGAQLREARERTKERKKTRDEARTRAQQLAEEEEGDWDGDTDVVDVDVQEDDES